MIQSTIDHATPKRDALRTKASQLQSDQKVTQADVAKAQDAVEQAMAADQKVVLTDRLEHLKQNLTRITQQQSDTSEQLQDAMRKYGLHRFSWKVCKGSSRISSRGSLHQINRVRSALPPSGYSVWILCRSTRVRTPAACS